MNACLSQTKLQAYQRPNTPTLLYSYTTPRSDALTPHRARFSTTVVVYSKKNSLFNAFHAQPEQAKEYLIDQTNKHANVQSFLSVSVHLNLSENIVCIFRSPINATM